MALAVVMADDELRPLPSGTVPPTRTRTRLGGVTGAVPALAERCLRTPLVPAIKYDDQWWSLGSGRSAPSAVRSTSKLVGENLLDRLRRTKVVLPSALGAGRSAPLNEGSGSEVAKAMRTSRSMAAGRTEKPQ